MASDAYFISIVIRSCWNDAVSIRSPVPGGERPQRSPGERHRGWSMTRPVRRWRTTSHAFHYGATVAESDGVRQIGVAAINQSRAGMGDEGCEVPFIDGGPGYEEACPEHRTHAAADAL